LCKVPDGINVKLRTVVVVLEAAVVTVKEQVSKENNQKPVSSKTSRYFMSTGRFQRSGMKR